MSAIPNRIPAADANRIVIKSKVEHVREAIIADIIMGKLRPGDRVREAHLAKHFGVSQATINQSLLDLHSQGIVSKFPNKETRVSCFGVGELEELFFVRKALECAAVEAVSSVRSPGVEASLMYRINQMRVAAKKKEVPGFYLADYEFHQELYDLSANHFLQNACQAIAAAPFAYLLTTGTNEFIPIDYHRAVDDHEEIVRAIMHGPRQAIRVTKAKLDGWRAADITFIKKHSAPTRG